MTSTGTLLEIEHATVYRGTTRVFEDLSLSLRLGEHTAVLGPNGAGKTTLLQLLTREVYPVFDPRTRMRLLGRRTWDVSELRRQLGIVSPELQLRYHKEIRGSDVVLSGFFGSIGVYPHQRFTAAQRQRATASLETLGAADLRDKPITAMSVGEQRRCLLARALVHEPHTLVLDEPTAGLDLAASLRFLGLLRDLARQGTTLVLVTHHLQEIPPEVESVVLLERGRVLARGPKRDVLTAENLSRAYDVPLRLLEEAGFYHVQPV